LRENGKFPRFRGTILGQNGGNLDWALEAACITLRTVRRSSRRIVLHAARRADFLVGQAIRLSPPAVSRRLVAANAACGAANPGWCVE